VRRFQRRRIKTITITGRLKCAGFERRRKLLVVRGGTHASGCTRLAAKEKSTCSSIDLGEKRAHREAFASTKTRLSPSPTRQISKPIMGARNGPPTIYASITYCCSCVDVEATFIDKPTHSRACHSGSPPPRPLQPHLIPFTPCFSPPPSLPPFPCFLPPFSHRRVAAADSHRVRVGGGA